MIRPFGLNDILLMRRLQRTSAALAIEHILTHPRAPLWVALTAPWPWAGVGVATYVLSEKSQGPAMAGFVQLIKRAARPEADLLHLAPALPAVEPSDVVGEAIWDQLLTHCARAAGGYGLQRIFASIPDGGPEEVCLKEVGFSLYTRETIHRLAVAPPAPFSRFEPSLLGRTRPGGRKQSGRDGLIEAGSSLLQGTGRGVPAGFRPQLPQDSWALQRLYTAGTPRLVQQAEGAVTGDVGSPHLSWWEPDRWHGIVWEPAGEVRGAVQVHVGRAGHWLRIWGTNMLAARELRALLDQGLRTIAGLRSYGRRRAGLLGSGAGPMLPVYVTVRDYETGLSGILTGFGFAPYIDRARFVKHTVATVRKPVPAALAGREIPQEVAVRSQFGMD